jgi:hypothetical protein
LPLGRLESGLLGALSICYTVSDVGGRGERLELGVNLSRYIKSFIYDIKPLFENVTHAAKKSHAALLGLKTATGLSLTENSDPAQLPSRLSTPLNSLPKVKLARDTDGLVPAVFE